jgi:hypothetical protein
MISCMSLAEPIIESWTPINMSITPVSIPPLASSFILSPALTIPRVHLIYRCFFEFALRAVLGRTSVLALKFGRGCFEQIPLNSR